MSPQTLLSLAGANPQPARLSTAVLVLIDFQNEYFSGPLTLSGVEAAADAAASVLARARGLGTPIIHIRHRGRPGGGGAFDPEAARFQIESRVAPQPGETVIDKGLPNAFAGTTLATELAKHPDKPLIILGFMTHMCVSATTRAALDAGRFSTVIADACATRDLPDPTRPGESIAADTIHRATLAALGDRFAVVCASPDLPD